MENTNHNRMERVLFLDVNIGSKEIAIRRSRLDNSLIYTNQSSASIDRRGHGDLEISFGCRKSCNEMSIDFRRNMNDGIHVNPLRTIGSIIPHITSLKSGTGI